MMVKCVRHEKHGEEVIMACLKFLFWYQSEGNIHKP
jgi:hypothetical protein